MTRDEIRAQLKRRIRAIEGRVAQLEDGEAGDSDDRAAPRSRSALPLWRFGLDAVDGALANASLQINALHDVCLANYADRPAAAAFAVALLRRLTRALGKSGRSLVLWCASAHEFREFGHLYGPGLGGIESLGFDPANLLVVETKSARQTLWAMEEGLKTPALAAVVGEVKDASLVASRRLMLAAASSGVACLSLRHARHPKPSVARSRWRIAARPSRPFAFGAGAPGHMVWRVELVRARGARPQTWTLEWNGETHAFRLAQPLADRPIRAARGGAGRVVALPRRA